jgi:PKHD-type hydroxylase
MSIFHFPPSPSFNLETSYATWNNGFTDDEIEMIIEIGESFRIDTATVGGDKENEDDVKIRKSKISWISNNDNTFWLYKKLSEITRKLNGQFFNFDLFGFYEDMQYTIYESFQKGHYDTHIDMVSRGSDIPQRKLSIVLQLSDQEQYEGGELQIFETGKFLPVEKKKGLLVAFPSYLPHKVTPVTSGIRRSLVVWVAGPPFK